MAGVNDIKTAVTAAKNDLKFGRKTILFMDEIHRFNKLQQVCRSCLVILVRIYARYQYRNSNLLLFVSLFKDIFLPHVESGVITLIGATTENPSFSLNSALLSRCRVIVLEKLSTDDVMLILKRSLPIYHAVILQSTNEYPSFKELGFTPK